MRVIAGIAFDRDDGACRSWSRRIETDPYGAFFLRSDWAITISREGKLIRSGDAPSTEGDGHASFLFRGIGQFHEFVLALSDLDRAEAY